MRTPAALVHPTPPWLTAPTRSAHAPQARTRQGLHAVRTPAALVHHPSHGSLPPHTPRMHRRPALAKGFMQLHSFEQQKSQPLEAHAAAFASVKVRVIKGQGKGKEKPLPPSRGGVRVGRRAGG